MSPHEKVLAKSTDDSTTDNPLNDSGTKLVATPTMCYHCFDVLLEDLQTASSTSPSKKRIHHKKNNWTTTTPAFASDLLDVSVECPLFVTWDKQNNKRDDHWNLRGCIGTLSPRLVVTSVGEYALISALHDRRFNPVKLSELPSLRVSVSLLVQYEVCENIHDWTVGVHGILIKFEDKNNQHFSATYLPEVPKEQGWDHKGTLDSLIQKAGYHGAVTPELLQSIHCTRYQSSKCKVTFDEYVLQHCQGTNPILFPNQQQHHQQQERSPRQSSFCNNL
jgi:uncharacterized protein (TIGR00296 family)